MDEPKNYKLTKDPNVVIGKKGVIITRSDFENANKNGYAWKDFEAYADYVGSWARPVKNPIPISPIYRAYGQRQNINGIDVAMLAAKDNPAINTILTRNIAKTGETPMYSAQDADAIRTLVNQEKQIAQKSMQLQDKMYNAMINAKLPTR